MRYSHLTDQENKALALMNKLIGEGWEYPDAQYKVSRDVGLSYEAVQELYDAQFGE